MSRLSDLHGGGWSLRDFVVGQKCVPWKVRLVARRVLPWKLRRVLVHGRWNPNTPADMDARYVAQGDDFISMENLYQHILPLLGEAERVLDVGCGIGVLMRWIHQRKPQAELLGVDFSQVAVERTRAYGFEARRCFLPEIPFADSSFDVVVCTEVLEHLDKPSACTGEFHRLLRPGGKLIVSVPEDMGPDKCPEHVQDFTEDTLRECLDQGLFDIVSVDAVVREPHRCPARSFLACAVRR